MLVSEDNCVMIDTCAGQRMGVHIAAWMNGTSTDLPNEDGACIIPISSIVDQRGYKETQQALPVSIYYTSRGLRETPDTKQCVSLSSHHMAYGPSSLACLRAFAPTTAAQKIALHMHGISYRYHALFLFTGVCLNV